MSRSVSRPPEGVAAVYVRLSRDRSGVGVNVADQVEKCRPLAEGRGYPPERIEVYCDNDLSAYNGKDRPRYRDLLRDIESGRVTFVAALHNDRVHRSMRELAHFIDLIRKTDIEVQTAQAGSFDLSTPSGRMLAFNLGNVAEYESAHKSERHLSAEERLAKAGKAHGGRRPFGFNEDRVTLREDEAKLVREATKRVLAGETLYALAKDWKRRGIQTPSSVNKRTGKITGGQAWVTAGLKKLLLSARIAGQREHHGRTVGKAEWAPIVTVEESTALRDVLLRPSRRGDHGGKGGNRPHKYLLSGLAFCAALKPDGTVCGGRMIARPSMQHRRAMQCADSDLRIVVDPMEEVIAEAVFQAVEGGALGRLMDEGQGEHVGELRTELGVVETKLKGLATKWSDNAITDIEWEAAREPLMTRRSALLGRIDAILQNNHIANIPDPLRASWPTMDFHQRRAVLETLIDRVEVKSAVRGMPRFDPDRIEILWKV